MKKIMITAAVLLLVATTVSAQNGKSIYNKYSDGSGVSCVYVSSAMFRMMGKLPNMEIDKSNVNLSGIINSLSGLYVIDSENAVINASLNDDIDKFISKGDYELMMEVKDDGETVRIYTVGDTETVTSFVLAAKDVSETTFICLDGNMSRRELEKVIAESNL